MVGWRFRMAALAAAWVVSGCSFLIEGAEEGRPCTDGRCPHYLVCVDDRCVRPDGPQVTCETDTDCSCDDGNRMCGADSQCHCLRLDGRFEGAGPVASEGRFGLTGASLTTAVCTPGEDQTELCGGLSP